MRPHPIHTHRHWRCAQYPVPLTCRWLEWPSIWMTIRLRNLITMLMPILLMTVHCYLHIAMRLQHITTIEKAVNSTAEKFKDHLKMADVRKAEIRYEINKSVSESSEQLDQKIDISSQPLRSEMKKLSDRLNIIQQRVNEAAMNRPSSTFSTSDRRTPVDGCVAQLRPPNIFNNNIGSDPAESPVVHNNTDVFSCDQAALWMVFSVCLSVRLSVCPSHLFDYVPIIVSSWNFQELSPRTRVHAKGQGQSSKVKVTEVTTQRNRLRTVTPVWIHIWWWNDTYSLMLLRRGALLFCKVIRQISRSHDLKIVEFDPDWAFPDCNSSLNSPMGTKCCTKLEVA